MTEIREAEEAFHKDVTELANAFADKFSKGEIENALSYPDDIHSVRACARVLTACLTLPRLPQMLRDKAVLTNVLNAGHDVTLANIDGKVSLCVLRSPVTFWQPHVCVNRRTRSLRQ